MASGVQQSTTEIKESLTCKPATPMQYLHTDQNKSKFSYEGNETANGEPMNNQETNKLNNKSPIFINIYKDNLRETLNSNLLKEINIDTISKDNLSPKDVDFNLNEISNNITGTSVNNTGTNESVGNLNIELINQTPDEINSSSQCVKTPTSCSHNSNISFYFGTNTKSKGKGHGRSDTCIRISLGEPCNEGILKKADSKSNVGARVTFNTPIVTNSPNLLPVGSPLIINKIQENSGLIGQQGGDESPGQMHSFVSYGPICRICHDDDDKEALLSPCNCCGSVAKVHKSCLERWLSSTLGGGKCELCGFYFSLVRKPKSFFQYLCQNDDLPVRRVLICDLICFGILTPLIFGVTYLCIVGAIKIDEIGAATWNETNLLEESPQQDYNSTTMYYSYRQGRFISRSNVARILKRGSGNTTNETSGLICLATILLVIYFSWIIMAARCQLSAWRKWRESNQEIRIVNTEQR